MGYRLDEITDDNTGISLLPFAKDIVADNCILTGINQNEREIFWQVVCVPRKPRHEIVI